MREIQEREENSHYQHSVESVSDEQDFGGQGQYDEGKEAPPVDIEKDYEEVQLTESQASDDEQSEIYPQIFTQHLPVIGTIPISK